ncbi:polysaccharide deacetylase family protein [Chloroflexota bacterium]
MIREKLFSDIRQVLRASIDFASIVLHPLCRLLEKNRVRILCYHRVCNLPETDDVMRYLNVPPAMFALQMVFLSQNGFNVITLEQFIEHRDKNMKFPPKSIIITFDDGYRDNYLNAFTILEKHNFKGTFFVATDYISSNRVFNWLRLGDESLAHSRENEEYWLPLRREEIREMGNQGACFGSHTKSHCHLNEVEQGKAMEELTGSKEYLEEVLAKPVSCFCYPFGEFSRPIKASVKIAGYKAAVSTKWGSNTLKSNPTELRRITIEEKDSLDRFVRKVDGAYDWWFRWLVPLMVSVQQLIYQRQRRK